VTTPLAKAEALVAELGRNAAAERAAILAEADAECAAIEAAARRHARTSAADTIADLRRAGSRRLARAEAELATARRYRQNADGNRAVERAWPRIEASLAARWADPVGRAAWVASLVAAGNRYLPRGTWTIAHPVDCDPLTHGTLFAGLEKSLPDKPEFRPTPDIAAGLRISVGSAVLDGTASKLVADRALIGGLLVAALQSPAKAGGNDVGID